MIVQLFYQKTVKIEHWLNHNEYGCHLFMFLLTAAFEPQVTF